MLGQLLGAFTLIVILLIAPYTCTHAVHTALPGAGHPHLLHR
jgi:hypothetical protein